MEGGGRDLLHGRGVLRARPGRTRGAADRAGGITLTERGPCISTRQDSTIAREAEDVAARLLVTEAFTPAGRCWPSYPSHRHDGDDFPRMTAL